MSRAAARSFSHPEFRRYFWGQLVSMTGSWMQQTAQGWLVYRLTGSGAMLGLVAAAGQAPSVVFGLLGGALADRWDRRRVLIATQTLALLQAAALAALATGGAARVWHVFALSAFLGLVNVFDMPARQAFVAELVPREDMGNAIALSGLLLNSSRLVGPAVAGLLIARAGEAACFWANSVSYLAVLASLLSIRPRPRLEAGGPWSGELARIGQGLRYAFLDPERRAILLLLGGVSVTGVPLFALMPALTEGALRSGPAGMGFYTSIFAVGALFASYLLAGGRDAGEPSAAGRAAAVFGAAIAALSVLRHPAAVAAAMFWAGYGMMSCFSGGNIRLQTLSSDAMRGRVMGLFAMTVTAASPFGMLASGWACDRWGIAPTLGALGLACCACGLVFLARSRAGRAVALAAAALAASGARAGAAPAVLSWEEAVAEASRANPELASSRLGVDAGRASYYASYNAFLPSLSLSHAVSESNSSPSPSWSAAASASMALFDAGKAASIRSAAASLSGAEAALRQTSASVRASLRQAFSSLLSAQASLDRAGRILEIRRHNAELVALRYDSGRESKGNMLRARAQALQAQAAASAAERGLRSARRELARRLGRESFEEFVASGTFSAAAPPPRSEDFRPLLALRPDVAVAEASLRGSRAALDAARAVLWPSLSANYSRSRSGGAEFPSARYGWSAGATLSYPLFGGGPTSAYLTAAASRRSLEKAQADLSAARQAALADLETAWSNLADAADDARVQEALLEAARQRNDEADVRYASGLMSFDNWEVIVSDRVNAERQAVSARRAAMDAETAWDRALGRALGE